MPSIESQTVRCTARLALLGWLTFAGVLWGRWRYGWRGRVALRWIVVGTVFVFLAYLGEKFVLEVLLRR